ncbi:hypothetical protein DCC79_07210 [bacterium]|mgnify:CR=1 FL=1|nr:hypothetical protein [Chloroflexi bacterium CFX6]RIL10711.1 MAG: hypothetical protein DCC79_07210 [bacterium]
MTGITLPKRTERALHELTGEARPEVALILVMRDAVAYRIQQLNEGLAAFEAKYGMSWDAYRERWQDETREQDYAWEAEHDYLEWEGMVTRKRRLEDAYGWLA